jgi:2-phospho-L-lactate guanylyltransferase
MNPPLILVPCKNLADGKSRLAGTLDRAARRDLCARLLAHTLACATAVVGAIDVRIVSGDRDAIAIGEKLSVAAIDDPGRGLNDALDSARARVIVDAPAVEAIAVLPIDLPDLDAQVLRAAFARPADIVIAPDEREEGTNLLLLRAAAMRAMRFAFGPRSFAAHLEQARSAGFTHEVLSDRRLAFDLDDPRAYAAWRAHRPTERAGSD